VPLEQIAQSDNAVNVAMSADKSTTHVPRAEIVMGK
jgi:hypothetical protein